MVSVSGASQDRGSSQPQQAAAIQHDPSPRANANRQGSLASGPHGVASSRLQSGWEPAQAYSRQTPQQINPGFVPGAQPVWPPGTLPYMQPQVFMYPGLPGNPPAFYPAQSMHGAQRPMPQMMPQVGMMVPPQQYSGVNPLFPFGVAPSPTPEQWLQARNIRPQAAMFQGVRPMGWGGVPFQSPPHDPRWQSSPQPMVASLPPQRPTRHPLHQLQQQQHPQQQQQQQFQQPSPPPPRVTSHPQLTQLDRQTSQPSLGAPISETQPASRSSSTSAIPRSAVQTEKIEQSAAGQDGAESAQGAAGKVPCAFFLKTGTCAYGDK